MTDAQFFAWLESSDAIKTLLVEAYANISGSETLLYLSNLPYNTGATDTPANTPYWPYLKPGIAFSESLSLTGDASISDGDIVISNPGGVRDAWLDYVWINRAVNIYIGDPRWVRSDFRLIHSGIVTNIDSTDPEQLNLHLKNKLAQLNNPMSETLLGGTTNNKGALIPQTFGEVFNATPLLEDPATLKYRYHTGASEGVIEVRDNGAPVSYTDTPSGGYFVLNQAPVGTITCSVQGDKPGGVYSNNISTLVQNIVKNYGPSYARLVTGDLDTTQLSAFASAHTQPVGLYSESRTNVIAACQQLCASIGAQLVFSSVGKLRIIQVALPATGTPTVITTKDMEYHQLSITQRPDVAATVKLGYCKNWSVQNTGLAGGLPASSAALFGPAQYLYATQSDATATTLYKQDVAPSEIDTLLLVGTDATAEALRRVTLWKTPRTVFTVRCRAHLLLTELGDTVTIVHSRFGMSGGKTGLVIGVQRDWLAGRVTIDVLI